jgi:hypothetical protein
VKEAAVEGNSGSGPTVATEAVRFDARSSANTSGNLVHTFDQHGTTRDLRNKLPGHVPYFDPDIHPFAVRYSILAVLILPNPNTWRWHFND